MLAKKNTINHRQQIFKREKKNTWVIFQNGWRKSGDVHEYIIFQ